MPEPPTARIRAPEFPSGLVWFDVDHPLSFEELRGKVVLLWFWNYASIECLHLLPDLKRLERRFRAELILIGVHGARFAGQRNPENVRHAIRRHDVSFPVVNDPDGLVHKTYGARGEPAFFLIDPEGAIHSYGWDGGGEPFEGVEPFEREISELIEGSDRTGGMNRRPVAGLRRETPDTLTGPAQGLFYPGKVLVDEEHGRLFIADSARHRILEADLVSGAVRRAMGAGVAGLIDGSLSRARFRNPQGMALVRGALMVADTGNHAIREIDLEREVVRTVAGTGEQARGPGGYGVRWPGRQVALHSPWDLVQAGDTLYITMAGLRQIWRLDLELEELAVHAGSGRNEILDGPHAQASCAKPTGFTTDGRLLYFVDSDASAVRSAGLGSDGEISTLTNAEESSPERRDPPAVRLQYPLGVVWRDGLLYVADTCNNALRVLDPQSRGLSTLAASEIFSEPAGVGAAGGHLYVADTNHHRILRISAATGEIEDWEIGFPPKLLESEMEPEPPGYAEEPQPVHELEEVVLAPGVGHFHFDLRLPAGYALNRAAPFELSADGDGVVVDVLGGPFQLHTGDPSFPLTIPLQLRAGRGVLFLVALLYYCEEPGERLCYYQSLHLRAPIRVSESAKPEARVIFHVEIPSGPI